jgi:hypothetical protein
MTKVAFLFLAMDSLPHASAWETYIQKPSRAFVHSFKPLNLNFAIQTPLTGQLKPRYASIGMVKALLHLLETAHRHGDYSHFITLSDSCLPLTTYNEFVGELGDESMFEWKRGVKSSEHRRRYDTLSPALQQVVGRPQDWLSSEAWFVLTRPHLERLLTFPHIAAWIEGMTGVYAPEEHFFINLAAHLFGNGLDTEFLKRGPTYVNWVQAEVDEYNRRRPRTYRAFAIEPQMKGYHFGRKFKGFRHVPKSPGSRLFKGLLIGGILVLVILSFIVCFVLLRKK